MAAFAQAPAALRSSAPSPVKSSWQPLDVQPATLPLQADLPPRAVAPSAAGLGMAALAASALASHRQRKRSSWSRAKQTRWRHVVKVIADECDTFEAMKLDMLGKDRFAKALAVNLDPDIYGSFAEIGAGQEVSRTFLTAGAAAGTVGRSISAYDMQLSDVAYGKAKRYVTRERLQQMMNTEYDILENTIRETRGPQTCFFAFASTLAARAYRSTRECEGWVGLTFQHAPGEPCSTVELHIRMADKTAQEQGVAVGILGTNLLYLCRFASNPYLITSYLLDGIETGRLEVDFAHFSGPAYPNVDPRLIAMKLVQFNLAKGVLMELDEQTGEYAQSVPNSALYKTPVNVLRSRFRPVTYAHKEVLDASTRKLKTELVEGARPPKEVLNLQIDDIQRPEHLTTTEGRMKRLKRLKEGDLNNDGVLSLEELKHMSAGKVDDAELEGIFKVIDVDGSGRIPIDSFTNVEGKSFLSNELLDRFSMLEPMGKAILVSSITQNYELAIYLSRYTNEQVVITVGGGSYSIERGLFKPETYAGVEGGMLEAFGRLFAKNVKIYEFPNVAKDGDVNIGAPPSGDEQALYDYLVKIGKINAIDKELLSEEVSEPSKNGKFRRGSSFVMKSIRNGSSEWEEFVPPEAATVLKNAGWDKRSESGTDVAAAIFKVLESL